MVERRKAVRRRTRKNGRTPSKRPWLVWGIRISIVLALLFSAWIVWMDAVVRDRFDGHKWTLPAKVYARPLALYPGLLVSQEQLVAELQWSDYRLQSGAPRAGTYARDGQDVIVYRRAFPFWDGQEPARRLRIELSNGRITSIHENGQELSLVRLEPQYIGGIFPAHNEDRELVRLEDIPPTLLAALIVTEDKAFFDTGVCRCVA